MIEKIAAAGIIPAITLPEIEKAEKLVQVLWQSGIKCVEVTFRAKGADIVISRMRSACQDMLIGAGTVLTADDAQKAVNAGAAFLVSPGFDRGVTEYALQAGVLPLPGCGTATEIQSAMGLGLKLVKFFPAEQLGGIDAVKALGGPFGTMALMPTGGISLNNLENYLRLDNVAACGGSFMVKEKLIRESNWETIGQLCHQAIEIVTCVRRGKEDGI